MCSESFLFRCLSAALCFWLFALPVRYRVDRPLCKFETLPHITWFGERSLIPVLDRPIPSWSDYFHALATHRYTYCMVHSSGWFCTLGLDHSTSSERTSEQHHNRRRCLAQQATENCRWNWLLRGRWCRQSWRESLSCERQSKSCFHGRAFYHLASSSRPFGMLTLELRRSSQAFYHSCLCIYQSKVSRSCSSCSCLLPYQQL